jgi:hypothetical protein
MTTLQAQQIHIIRPGGLLSIGNQCILLKKQLKNTHLFTSSFNVTTFFCQGC